MTKTIYDPDEDGKIANAQLTSGVDIADAISKKHSNLLDHSNHLDHDGNAQDIVIAGKTTLAIVKSDTDVAGAISHSLSAHAPANAQKNSDITKGEIEAKLTGEISTHTHAGGGGDGETTVVATQDTANNTTTLANAIGLTFNALPNSIYIIEVFLIWASSATSVGIKVSATASGSPAITAGLFTAQAANGTPDSSGWNTDNTVVTTSASPFTTNSMGKIDAVLKTSGSSSTWQLRFAAETTGTITIKSGSVLRYRKVI
ncbi:MAG: hypothetical protein PHN78_05350 [Dehalococcoidales bacterium]|nr:hypothetical protein [Dehalococcoidales bacterium]